MALHTTARSDNGILRSADVCLILEGSYPYVFGGVSSWTQGLITSLAPLTFNAIAIRPADPPKKWQYDPPENFVGLADLSLNFGRETKWRITPAQEAQFAGLLCDLAILGEPIALTKLLTFLRRHAIGLDVAALLDGPSAWRVMRRCYMRLVPGASFVQFYWAWRSFFGASLRILMAPLPPAKVYHAVTTGYAGLLAARAVLETGRPAILTEHGIYTNERRIDLMLAPWLSDSFSVISDEDPERPRDIRDFWITAFESLARICYLACDDIVSLSETARREQIALGAAIDKTRVVPNGIDITRFSNLPRKTSGPPRIALIGRVVAIKDIISFLHSVALLATDFPDLEALIVGPDEEEPEYAQHCRDVCSTLGLDGTVTFTGLRSVDTVLAEIDVLVLTSASESLPLVLLEAGAAGIPCVATNVGACRDIIDGQPGEDPALGTGGRIIRLGAPQDIAGAIAELLNDPELRQSCGAILQSRVARSYGAETVRLAYRDLYHARTTAPDNVSWQG